MNDRQAKPKLHPGSKQPENQRRTFICKGGAALSAALAAAAGMAGPRAAETTGLQQQVDKLNGQLGVMQDTHAIRALHADYGRYLEQRNYAAIVDLFTGDGDVQINGEVYAGKERGIRRLYIESFGAGISDDNRGPVHGLLRDHPQHQDSIVIAPDRRTATACFHSFVQVLEADNINAPFLEMARLQGQGIRQRWEAGIYENTYLKDGGTWKIKRLVYQPLGQAGDEATS